MPINDPPRFEPTHAPDEYYGKFYVSTDLMNTHTIDGSSIVATSSAFAASTSNSVDDLKKQLAEEHEKRILAESREAVLKVRLENKNESKQDDEDEIDRLSSEVNHYKKIHRDVMFILADSAASPSAVAGHSINSYRGLVQQITQALKQEPRKM